MMNVSIKHVLKNDQLYLKILLIFCILFGSGLFISRIVEIPWRSALRGWDNSFYYMWTRSVVIDRDIDFHNERELNNTIASKDINQFQQVGSTETGYLPNKYGIGWGLSAIPFFLVADFLVMALNLAGFDNIQRDGYGPIYQIVQQVGHLIYAIIGLIFALRVCEYFFCKTISKIALFTVWGASMLPYYQCLNLSMAHNLTFTYTAICYLASLRLWLDNSGNERRWIAVLWFSSGMLVVTRYQAAVYLIFPAIVILRLLYEKRNIGFVLGLFPMSLLPVLLQLLAWNVIYGSYFVNTYSENQEGFNWDSPALIEVLFSSNHGLFYWHPMLFIGCVGFVFFVFRNKSIGFIWFLSLIITYFINASWWCWWLGSSFGLRNFEASILFFIVGFAFVIKQIKDSEKLWLCSKVLMLLFFIWNVNLSILYSVNIISRNSSVSWQEMLKATFEFYPSIINLFGTGL